MRKFNKIIGSLALLVCMFALFCFSGCTFFNKEDKATKNAAAENVDIDAYMGSYTSFFVDAQNEASNIHFSLVLEENNKFYFDGNGLSYEGEWKTFTQDGKVQMICYETYGYQWNELYPNLWSPYFTLSFLDDGTLMATPAVKPNAFGGGEFLSVTLVLFEKL